MAFKIIEEVQPLTQKYSTKTQIQSESFLKGLAFLRLRKFHEARQALYSARDQANQVLYTGRWAYRYHRAFAQAGLILLVPANYQSGYLNQARESFQEAVEVCGWVGILDEALIVLHEMQKADPEQLLQPIEDYLVKQRAIAWNNQPEIN